MTNTETTVKPAPAEIRQWARATGYQIGNRGKISSEIINAYTEAHTVVIQG